MPTKTLLKVRFFIAIFITIAIAYLSLIKLGKQPIHINHLDKIEHAIAYFFLTLSWLVAVSKSNLKINYSYTITAFCVLFGIIIEVMQGVLTTYREASFLDMLANSFGALIALLIFKKFFEKK